MKFESGKSSGKLAKMSMPGRKKPDVTALELELAPDDHADMADEGPGGEGPSEADMANELEGEGEGENDSEGSSDKDPATDVQLSDASDDELLSEMRKRGLSGRAEKASKDEPTSDSDY